MCFKCSVMFPCVLSGCRYKRIEEQNPIGAREEAFAAGRSV